uniref:Solute-binding protein family 3/N-terminal domain-containing protein n=1 Tax=Panagrolaimus sp. ES5 TaxID=591445 RepID=A0AC34FJ46_9BILA
MNRTVREKIRVVFARNPPDAFSNCPRFPTLDATISCPFPGWTVEILKQIIDYLGYDIEPIVTTAEDGHVDWGSYVNNSWEGTLGYLSNDSADVICLLYQLTQLRGRYFSYSYSVYNVIWRYVKVQMNQREDFVMKSFSGNLAVIIFSLVQARVMMALYQQLLLSSIIAPPNTDPFKSADDVIQLVANGEYKIITNYIQNWYFEDLAYSESAHFRDLRAAIANNPIVVADSVNDVLDYVELGGYIFPIQEDSLAMQMSKQRCGLVYVSNGLPEKAAYFVFQKNSTLSKIWNPAIKMQIDYVIKIYNKYFTENNKIGNLSKCNEDDAMGVSSKNQNLSLITTFGIFLVVIFGLLISIITFIFEIYFAWQHNVIKLSLRRRRTRAAEPIHLMALAEKSGKKRVRKILTPTSDEEKEYITIANSGFPY